MIIPAFASPAVVLLATVALGLASSWEGMSEEGDDAVLEGMLAAGGAPHEDLAVPGPGAGGGGTREAMDETVAIALSNVPEPGRIPRQPDALGGHGSEAGDGRRPLLRELPAGCGADLVVMEWVEFLVAVGGRAGARRAIGYYETAGWLGPGVAERLREFVAGLPGDASVADGGGEDLLSADHHSTSLTYIDRLTGDGRRGRDDGTEGRTDG